MANYLELLLQNDRLFLNYITFGFFIFAIFSLLILPWIPAPYGRYSASKWGRTLDPKISWFIQEFPSVVVPICLLIFTECPRSSFWPNKVLTALFLLHYIHRYILKNLLYSFKKYCLRKNLINYLTVQSVSASLD